VTLDVVGNNFLEEASMADRFEQLKTKYQSVLNFIQSQGAQLNMDAGAHAINDCSQAS
jgi:hypothetical protein